MAKEEEEEEEEKGQEKKEERVQGVVGEAVVTAGLAGAEVYVQI